MANPLIELASQPVAKLEQKLQFLIAHTENSFDRFHPDLLGPAANLVANSHVP